MYQYLTYFAWYLTYFAWYLTYFARLSAQQLLTGLWHWNKVPWIVRCLVSRHNLLSRPHFYQTRSAWSVDQGSNKNHSPAYNFAPTVTKFCVMWEGLSLPPDTKFGNCRCKIVDSRSFPSWSLIHGLRWSGLIKVGPVGSIACLSSLKSYFRLTVTNRFRL